MGLLSVLRDRGLPLRALDLIRHEVADSGSAAVYVRQLLRGNRATRDVLSSGPPAVDTPVLLIHGYLATRGSLHLLERRLSERGHVVMTYRLGPVNLGDIRDSAALIARKVESVVAQTGVQRVDIIGHSMGGLVGLYYVKRLGGRHRVRRLVLLGTPARGTWSALFALFAAPLGRASLQLLPGSPFLRELASWPIPPGLEVIAVAGQRDWLAPVRSTVLHGVRQVSIPTSHSGLLVDEEVATALDKILRGEAAATEPSTDRSSDRSSEPSSDPSSAKVPANQAGDPEPSPR